MENDVVLLAHFRMLRLARLESPESPRFLASAVLASCYFPESPPKYTQFRGESLSQPPSVLCGSKTWKRRARFRNEIRRWLSSRTRTFASEFFARVGIFPVFSPRISRRREFPGRISAVDQNKETRGHRHTPPPGSPVCKKELSSNRINDPLASIYRTRRGWRGRDAGENTPPGRARTNSSNCLPGRTERQLFLHVVLLPRVAPRARKILFAFLWCREVSTVAGSLTARASPDASVNPVFGLHPFAWMRDVGRSSAGVVGKRKYLIIHFSRKGIDSSVRRFKRSFLLDSWKIYSKIRDLNCVPIEAFLCSSNVIATYSNSLVG